MLAGLAATSITMANAVYADHDKDGNKEDKDYEKEIIIMHTGDLHGDLTSHTNDREDAVPGVLEGGLARVATIVKKIREKHGDSLIWGHTGDTTSGSAIATYTQGGALVDVWDALAPDVFATGNWEYAYGIYRYLQLFGAEGDIEPIAAADESKMAIPPYDPSGNIYQGGNAEEALQADQNGEKRRWRTIAANVYYNGEDVGPGIPNAKQIAGELLTDPYLVKTVNGIKIGFIGCTTNRGPQVVSSNITKGVTFSNCMGGIKFPQNKPIQWPVATDSDGNEYFDHPNVDPGDVIDGVPAAQGGDDGFRTVPEIVKFTHILRTPQGEDTPYINSATGLAWKGEGVDIVVLMSEAGIPENIWNAEHTIMPEGIRFPEVVLSSDTHEETKLPVVVTTPTGDKVVLIEEGEDGAQVGVLDLEFKGGKLKEWEWKAYTIDETIPEDEEIAQLIAQAEAPFHDEEHGGTWKDGDEFVNPYNGYVLTVPLNKEVAATEIVLERNRFSHERDETNLKMPAVIEGTLHDVYVDAFRVLTGADVGGIRGFRYTNTIMPGPITIDDIYHSLSIGAMVAVGPIPASPEAEDEANGGGNCVFDTTDNSRKDNTTNKCHNMAWPRNLLQEIELSGNSTQQTNIPGWGGGWFWNYSGITMDLDPYKGNFDKFGGKRFSRVTNLVFADGIGLTDRDGDGKLKKTNVKYASYYYDADYNRINRNQLVTDGSCTKAGLDNNGKKTRACADTKIKVLAKAGKDYGAPMLLVSTTQFLQGKKHAADPNNPPVVVDGIEYDVRAMDVVEAVGRYIDGDEITVTDISSGTAAVPNVRQGLNGAATYANFAPTFPRINLLRDLPNGHDEFGFGVIQPFRGALEPSAQTLFADPPNDEGKF